LAFRYFGLERAYLMKVIPETHSAQ